MKSSGFSSVEDRWNPGLSLMLMMVLVLFFLKDKSSTQPW
jgi:hypothetical protein